MPRGVARRTAGGRVLGQSKGGVSHLEAAYWQLQAAGLGVACPSLASTCGGEPPNASVPEGGACGSMIRKASWLAVWREA